jgi:hypothetical protein
VPGGGLLPEDMKPPFAHPNALTGRMKLGLVTLL